MTTRYSSKNCRPVKLAGDKNYAVYAIEVDGVRLEHLRVFVFREYHNAMQTRGWKGVKTKVSIVDKDKLAQMRAEKRDIGEIERETTLVEASSLKAVMAKFCKKLSEQ